MCLVWGSHGPTSNQLWISRQKIGNKVKRMPIFLHMPKHFAGENVSIHTYFCHIPTQYFHRIYKYIISVWQVAVAIHSCKESLFGVGERVKSNLAPQKGNPRVQTGQQLKCAFVRLNKKITSEFQSRTKACGSYSEAMLCKVNTDCCSLFQVSSASLHASWLITAAKVCTKGTILGNQTLNRVISVSFLWVSLYRSLRNCCFL